MVIALGILALGVGVYFGFNIIANQFEDRPGCVYAIAAFVIWICLTIMAYGSFVTAQ